jgi:hypothetical protein
MLGLSLHAWENIMLGSLAFAAVAAAVVGVATYCVVQLQRVELAASKEEFEKYKIDTGKEIAAANAVGDSAKAEAAKANEKTASLQKEADEARLETQRLKQQVAWRRITRPQHDALVSALTGKKIDFFLSFVDADPESALFPDDIDRTMKDAGLKPSFFSGWQRAVGLSIAGTDSPELTALVEAFDAAGLPLVRKPIDHPSFKIELLVGSKPPVF